MLHCCPVFRSLFEVVNYMMKYMMKGYNVIRPVFVFWKCEKCLFVKYLSCILKATLGRFCNVCQDHEICFTWWTIKNEANSKEDVALDWFCTFGVSVFILIFAKCLPFWLMISRCNFVAYLSCLFIWLHCAGVLLFNYHNGYHNIILFLIINAHNTLLIFI